MRIQYFNTPNFKLIIPEKLYNELLAQVRHTTLEVTMILSIEKTNKYTYEVTAINYPPQWNEAAETKTVDKEYPSWCIQQIKQNIKINGHLHTHPNMAVAPSGYDNNFFKELTNDTSTFQFRLILNQKGLIRADLIDKVESHAVITNVPVIVPCKGFELVISEAEINFNITNVKELKLLSINNKMQITVISNYLQCSTDNIVPTPLKEEDYIKTRTRYQAGEGYKAPYYNTSLIPGYDDEEDFPQYPMTYQNKGANQKWK